MSATAVGLAEHGQLADFGGTVVVSLVDDAPAIVGLGVTGEPEGSPGDVAELRPRIALRSDDEDSLECELCLRPCRTARGPRPSVRSR